ncbi:MAG: hypothetical protein PHY90_10535, partial [Desulfitobacteriaceae bacterium]|nr:hypothetical protein [Desulfitobacteriaceae bacterium]
MNTAINAINGNIEVTLSEAPETAPVAADFAFTQKIDAAAATALATTDFAWAAADKKATFKFAEVAATDAEQSVVISVDYKGSKKDAAAFKVAAKPAGLAVESVSAINATTLKV